MDVDKTSRTRAMIPDQPAPTRREEHMLSKLVGWAEWKDVKELLSPQFFAVMPPRKIASLLREMYGNFRNEDLFARATGEAEELCRRFGLDLILAEEPGPDPAPSAGDLVLRLYFGQLFHGSTTYVTVSERTNTAAAARLCRFWEALGSRPVVTDPAHHDALCALLSHVPHLAASGLVELIAQSGEDPEFLRALAGSGFRDTTRVALGSGTLWAEICSHNREEIAAGLERTAGILRSLAADVRTAPHGEIAARLDAAARLRARLDQAD